jgi:menaquinone-dependent protoporphyrinogen IX oxidase
MKRVLIVWDSKFGNTRQLAEYIAEGVAASGTAEAVVVGIKEVESQDMASFDGVLFGAPVHAFRATR